MTLPLAPLMIPCKCIELLSRDRCSEIIRRRRSLVCLCSLNAVPQQFRALIPGPREHVISTGRACFRVTRAIFIRNREWTDFIRLISRSRKLICTRTDEFGLIIARVRAILNETGQTPYEDRVLVRKNYCMTYWQLEDTWLIYGLCQLIPCTEYVAGY